MLMSPRARRRAVLSLGLAAAVVMGLVLPAAAQEVTLRVQHFLPPPSTTHKDFIEPWTRKVEAESGGRIKIEIYPSMQLGGKPPALYDQVRDGVVDIVWTLPGYTAGRFPIIEVFELPFLAASAEATSQAAEAQGASFHAIEGEELARWQAARRGHRGLDRRDGRHRQGRPGPGRRRQGSHRQVRRRVTLTPRRAPDSPSP